MEIIYPPNLLSSLKDKYLLLDTNIFIDASKRPEVYARFFNNLKKAEVTLATIDLVKYEVLKGSASEIAYTDREKFVDSVIDTVISTPNTIYPLAYQLLKEYGAEGAALKITDLILGAFIRQYKNNIYVITRDTTDFLQRLFELEFIVNYPHDKGIFTYGVYKNKNQ